MPPRTAPPPQHPPASPSPPPLSAGGDAQDLLIIQDFMDTLDQVPLELTKVHSDLNELGAVLYSTLVNLELKLNQLVDWIQDASVGPEKRFQLLQEIAEEAARYKLGGDDKIRVAGGACDGIMAHQKHITNLLNASTLLNPAPPSPYTQSLTLSLPTISNTRRGQLARAANSPFGGRGYASGSGVAGEKVGETPTKKKKSRVQQLGKDDDDASSVGGPKKTVPKKRRPVNRATSPADSIGSASAFTSNKVEPRTARQLAAAANKARKAEREVESDESGEEGTNALAMQVTPSQDSMMDRRDGGLGLDFGHSRETTGATNGRASTTATPLLAQSGIPVDKGRNGQRPRGMKRGRGDDENGEGSDEEDGSKPPAKRSGNGKKTGAEEPLGDMTNEEAAGDGGWESEQVYCVCRGVSFGEMIGCDNDDCELEWFHLSCVGLDKTPEGSWFCPACTEKKKNGGKVKRPAAKSRRK